MLVIKKNGVENNVWLTNAETWNSPPISDNKFDSDTKDDEYMTQSKELS